MVNVHHEAQVVCEGKTADNAMSEAPGQKPERRPDREEPQQTSEARRDEGPDGGTAAGPRPTKSVNARRVLSARLAHEDTSAAGMKPPPENTQSEPGQTAKLGGDGWDRAWPEGARGAMRGDGGQREGARVRQGAGADAGRRAENDAPLSGRHRLLT